MFTQSMISPDFYLVYMVHPGHLIGVEAHAVPDRLHVGWHVHHLKKIQYVAN